MDVGSRGFNAYLCCDVMCCDVKLLFTYATYSIAIHMNVIVIYEIILNFNVEYDFMSH